MKPQSEKDRIADLEEELVEAKRQRDKAQAESSEVWDYIKARCDRLADVGIEIDHPDAETFVVLYAADSFPTRVAALVHAEALAAKLEEIGKR